MTYSVVRETGEVSIASGEGLQMHNGALRKAVSVTASEALDDRAVQHFRNELRRRLQTITAESIADRRRERRMGTGGSSAVESYDRSVDRLVSGLSEHCRSVDSRYIDQLTASMATTEAVAGPEQRQQQRGGSAGPAQ